MYHPPGLKNNQKEATVNHIISSMAKFIKKHKSAKFLLAGDFNDLDTTDITNLFPVQQIVDFPTRGENCLDLIFTDIDGYIQCKAKPEPPISTNDHIAICVPSVERPSKPKYRSVTKRIVTPKAKIALTDELMTTCWDDLSQESSVDRKVEILQNRVSAIFDKHCPSKHIRVPCGKACVSTPLMRKLSRAKQRAHKKKKPHWKFLSKLLASHQQTALKRQTSDTINSSIRGSGSWWKNVKQLIGEQKTNNQSPTIFIDDCWLSPRQLARKLNDHYLQTNNITTDFPEIPTTINNINVSEEEVYNLMTKIDTKKSTHSEDFPSWITKNNAHILCEPVSNIINSVLAMGQYPTPWKRSEITPIPKVKNPSQLKQMRPISLLHHLGKLTEKVIAKRLRSSLPKLKNQFAYTPRLGTTDALVKLTSDVVRQLDDKNTLAIQTLMLDFSKAFDNMRPDIAITKLLSLNVDPQIVTLIKSFLMSREQCVVFQGYSSDYQSSRVGVPQGTILGPLLWNSFIDDLNPPVATLKYADDTTLYTALRKDEVTITDSTSLKATVTPNHNRLQEAATYAAEWCHSNKMTLNTAKSSMLTFTLRKKITAEPIVINGSAVSEDKTSKLLGVILDQNLKFSHHVDAAIDKARPTFHAIIHLRKAGVATNSLLLFYKARVIPLLTYAAPSWYPFLAQYSKDKLERYQRLCLRIILPHVDGYDNRLSHVGLTTIISQLETICKRYAAKITAKPEHALYDYILSETSKRSGRPISAKCRTELLSKSLFHKYRV